MAPVYVGIHRIGLRRGRDSRSRLHCIMDRAIDLAPRERITHRAIVADEMKTARQLLSPHVLVYVLCAMPWLATPARAHLLPAQTATMNLVDRAAFFVVAVPASALHGVDTDGDGRLSLAELDRGKAYISAQFDARFHATSNGQSGRPVLTWVVPPDEGAPSMDYVVIMHRVDFADTPTGLVVTTDLFGTAPGQAVMTLTATRGAATEVAVLRPGADSHHFFSGIGALFADWKSRLERFYSLLAAAIARWAISA